MQWPSPSMQPSANSPGEQREKSDASRVSGSGISGSVVPLSETDPDAPEDEEDEEDVVDVVEEAEDVAAPGPHAPPTTSKSPIHANRCTSQVERGSLGNARLIQQPGQVSPSELEPA